MRYERNAEELKEALYRHTPVGQKVMVPIFGEAVIVSGAPSGPGIRHVSAEGQESYGLPWTIYKVRAKTPVPFSEWVRLRLGKRGDPNVPMNLQDWIAGEGTGRYRGRTDESGRDLTILPMADYLRDRLEQGGKISRAEVEHEELLGRGCLDKDDNVFCYTFWSGEVHIAPGQLEKGQFVEYTYKLEVAERVFEDRIMQGRILGFGKIPGTQDEAVFFEFFTPTPYLEMPDSLVNPMIQRSFHSEGTYALGYGTHEAMELAQEESGEDLIPPGKWDTHHRIYTLKEFLPLSIIEDLCKTYEAEGGFCFWQALIMYVVPLDLYGEKYPGIWHPLPKHAVDPKDVVISYDLEE